MKRIAIILFSLLSYNSHAELICSQEILQKNISENHFELEMLRALELEKQLLVLGDVHYSTSPELLESILSILAPKTSKEKKCLFFELAASHSPEEWNNRVLQGFRNATTENEKFKLHQFDRYYGRLIRAGKQLGFTLRAVDHPKQLGQFSLTLNKRDATIIKEISDNFKSGQCSSGILIIGKAHITADELNRITIKARLNQMGLAAFTFNILHASDPYPRSIWSYNRLCDRELTQIGKPIIFSNESVGAHTPMWPNNVSEKILSGEWNDFDFTILAP